MRMLVLLVLLALAAALCAGCAEDPPPRAPRDLRAHCAEWAKAVFATRCDPDPNELTRLGRRCRNLYGYP